MSIYFFVLIMIGIILVVVSIIKKNYSLFMSGIMLWICSIVGAIVYTTEPKAIDVYAGKTAMEYTIINGVKVDSTVIKIK